MAICQLCKKDKKLIKAHIIPEWAFNFLYTKNGKSKPLIIVGADLYTKKRPIGSYDNTILCGNCDSLIGKNYDEPAKDYLSLRNITSGDVVEHLNHVDLTTLKLFLLSVVWRAGITGIEDFAMVSIGAYKERIRELIYKHIILNKHYVDTRGYDIIITRYSSKKHEKIVNDLICLPYNQRMDGVNYVCLFFPNAYKIFIKLDQRPIPNDLMAVTVDRYPKTAIILPLGDLEHSGDYKSLINAVHKAKN